MKLFGGVFKRIPSLGFLFHTIVSTSVGNLTVRIVNENTVVVMNVKPAHVENAIWSWNKELLPTNGVHGAFEVTIKKNEIGNWFVDESTFKQTGKLQKLTTGYDLLVALNQQVIPFLYRNHQFLALQRVINSSVAREQEFIIAVKRAKLAQYEQAQMLRVLGELLGFNL